MEVFSPAFPLSSHANQTSLSCPTRLTSSRKALLTKAALGGPLSPELGSTQLGPSTPLQLHTPPSATSVPRWEQVSQGMESTLSHTQQTVGLKAPSTSAGRHQHGGTLRPSSLQSEQMPAHRRAAHREPPAGPISPLSPLRTTS